MKNNRVTPSFTRYKFNANKCWFEVFFEKCGVEIHGIFFLQTSQLYFYIYLMCYNTWHTYRLRQTIWKFTGVFSREQVHVILIRLVLVIFRNSNLEWENCIIYAHKSTETIYNNTYMLFWYLLIFTYNIHSWWGVCYLFITIMYMYKSLRPGNEYRR